LLGDLKAIPMEQRPNPIADGKDPLIDMEPLTRSIANRCRSPRAGCSIMTGDGAAVARPAALARRGGAEAARAGGQQLRQQPAAAGDVLAPDGRELRNAGYERRRCLARTSRKRRCAPAWRGTTSFYGKAITARSSGTGVCRNGKSRWRRRSSFLQSCLALRESKAQPLFDAEPWPSSVRRRALTSGSGGAASLAFFDAVVYDGASVGAALRQSKNFLLAYSLLKEKRLGKDAQRTGANLRAAWAFTLWGDPTLHLPQPSLAADASPPVTHTVRGNTITLQVPPERPDKVLSSKYRPRRRRMPGWRDCCTRAGTTTVRRWCRCCSPR